MKAFLLCISFVSVAAHGKIVKIKSYKESEKHLSRFRIHASHTWFVFDIDNTLMTPNLQDKEQYELALKASDTYLYQQRKLLYEEFRKIHDHDTANKLSYRKVMDDYNEATKANPPMRVVEDGMAAWIKDWQKKGFSTMAFTARETVLTSITTSQLQALDMTFHQSPLSQFSFEIKKETLEFAEDVHFQKGLYFVGLGGHSAKDHKGKTFTKLLATLKSKSNFKQPSKVVFFDDRLEHVQGMEKLLKDHKIGFLGFHYTNILEETDVEP